MEKPKKLIVYLIRHAEKDLDRRIKYPKEYVRLSTYGKNQAIYLAKRFKGKKINKIISSDLKRCVETAEPISKLLSIPIKQDKDLREVSREPGLMDLNSKKPYKRRVRKGEVKRIKRAWNKIIKEKGEIIVISSGGVNRVIFSLILEMSSNYPKFSQNPTGVNVITKNMDNIVGIKHVNDISHLPKRLMRTQVN
jgi:broad specificity phosphatase PhoE|tara:strand:- start:151 stop:732 length:582 start_codon:yes stop_codon:yes gene_type:complete